MFNDSDVSKNALGFYLPKINKDKKKQEDMNQHVNMCKKMHICDVSIVIAQTVVKARALILDYWLGWSNSSVKMYFT